jgi:hypothetical protein
VSTHEREITDEVELCTPSGHLDPVAVGWSRRPLHTVSLRGWGRNKRWDYWAILAGDLVVSLTYADVDYLGIADVWWADLAADTSGGRGATPPLARGLHLPDRPGTAPLRFGGRNLRMEVSDEPADGRLAAATVLHAEWLERDGTPGRLAARVELPEGHESLNVVIPWDDRRFQYTSKHQARPVTGTLQVGDRRRRFGGERGEAWGALDVGRGRWPYRTNWNWGGGAGHAVDGTVVGLQLGGRWTVGTGFTENGLIVAGELHKVGCELAWSYSWEAPLDTWQVSAPDGSLDLRLEPRYDKHSRTDLGLMGMEVHQVFGQWTGTVRTDDGRELELRGVQGFAEEARSRW